MKVGTPPAGREPTVLTGDFGASWLGSIRRESYLGIKVSVVGKLGLA